MAILLQADYWPHVARMVRRAIQERPDALLPLMPGLMAYARLGADQRTAVRMLLTWWWETVQDHAPDGHAVRHVLAAAGVPDAWLEDIPSVREPQA